MPDTYRGLIRDSANPGLDYAGYVESVLTEMEHRGEGLAGFIAESILSCGGQVMLPKGYLKAVYAMIRRRGGLCIADEVQVGFGRVGSHFWGFELQGVVPDVVTLGKPIGNGHPMGAVITTKAVANAFNNGMEFFSTFGGNPVSCAIGHAVLEVIENEQLQQNAQQTGNYLLQNLRDLQSHYPIIGDVRGTGLFLGIELVHDPIEKTPATHQATYLVNRMRQMGILLSTDGPQENVIKIKPPLCFNQDNGDFFLTTLSKVLKEDYLQV